MLRAVLFLALASLPACTSGHELSGAEADAWALCKKELELADNTRPPHIQKTKDNIIFAWDADSESGPIICKTNAAGSVLIEGRVRTGF
jgi:hypothetical protein